MTTRMYVEAGAKGGWFPIPAGLGYRELELAMECDSEATALSGPLLTAWPPSAAAIRGTLERIVEAAG